MPYELRGRCVIRADTGEVVKCHGTRAKALAHIRALGINVSMKEKTEGGEPDTWVTLEQMRSLCPDCAGAMERMGITGVDLAKAEGQVSEKVKNLAKHLVKKYGNDPGFWGKCDQAEELQGYEPEVRAAICAMAHKEATGEWPGTHLKGKKKSKSASGGLLKAFSFFKIDSSKGGLPAGVLGRLHGYIALQEPDGEDEVCDVLGTLPAIEEWCKSQHEMSDGVSWGNVRDRHGKEALPVGILLEKPELCEAFSKRAGRKVPAVRVVAGITDPVAWSKCSDSRTYCGFSLEGMCGANMTPDPDFPMARRYVGTKVFSLALADRSCMPGAQFTVLKTDGVTEQEEHIEILDEEEKSDSTNYEGGKMEILRTLQQMRDEFELKNTQAAELVTNAIALIAEATRIAGGSEPETEKEEGDEEATEAGGEGMQKTAAAVVDNLNRMIDAKGGREDSGISEIKAGLDALAARFDAFSRTPVPGGPHQTVAKSDGRRMTDAERAAHGLMTQATVDDLLKAFHNASPIDKGNALAAWRDANARLLSGG